MFRRWSNTNTTDGLTEMHSVVIFAVLCYSSLKLFIVSKCTSKTIDKVVCFAIS